jgi:glycosyltransferase involved in cell wall biosynthesis
VTGEVDGGLRATVLFATFNRRDLLPRVLAPLLADPAASEIVVVVDGCRDGSLELLQQMAVEHPVLKPIFVENRGAVGALLAGAEAATGDVLVILDDDEIVEEAPVARHLRHHQEEPGLVVVGYVQMDLPAVRRRGDFGRYKYDRAYEADCRRWEADPDTVLRNLWGGYMSMCRDDYLRVATDLTQPVNGYHYDLAFGARCLELGYRGRFDRGLRALHLYERDQAAFLRDARSSGRNRILLHRAHAEVLGPLDDSFVDDGLPGWAAALVNLAVARPRVRRWVDAAVALVGTLRLWDLETKGGILLWAIEQKRGALEAMSTLEDQPSPLEAGR